MANHYIDLPVNFGVLSIDGMTGALTLVAGTGITIVDNPGAGTITISSSALLTAITSINGDTTSAQTLSVGTSGTDFAIANPGGGSHVFNLPTASAVNRGALSSADWTTFNNKQSLLSIGTYDSQTPSANGLVLSSSVLYAQSASATVPGMVNNDPQTFTGEKAFVDTINADGGIDRSTLGTLTIGATNSTVINIGNSGATVNIQGTTIYENTPQLLVADPLITVNHGGGAGSGQNAGIQVEEASSITGYAETSADRNSWILKAPNTAGIATITPGVAGITLDQSSHNPVTIGSPANGLSVDGSQVVSLGLSSTSTTGALSNTDWNTFNNKQAAGNYITALTGDVTASGPGSVAATLATVNANTGSFGSSTAIPNFTVNGKGLITAAGTSVVIAPAGTLTGTTLASNVVSSSLTSVGTITSGTWNGTTIAAANGGTGVSNSFNLTIAATSSISGTNTGDITLAAVNSSPNANAATLTGQVLNLQPFDSTHPGVVTASGGGTTNFLRADGTWAAPSGGSGTVTSVAMTVPSFLSVSGSPITTSGTLAVTLSGTALPVANGGTGATTLTNHGVLLGQGTSAVVATTAGSAGQILTSSGAAADPTWTTATYPATTTINQILYSNATNTVTGLATTNTGALVTSSSGVPSLASGTTANRLLRTNGTTVSFAQAALTTDVTGTLPVGNGGTGTATAFTAGSVVYAGASGVYTQSNANFFWSNANSRLGLGTASPGSRLTVTSAATDHTCDFQNTGVGGAAVYANATNTDGIGVVANAASGVGIQASSNTNASAYFVPSDAGNTAATLIVKAGAGNVFNAQNNSGATNLSITSDGYMIWAGESRVTSTFTKTSSTALASITGLSATLVSGQTYQFTIILYTTSGASGGIQVDLNGGTATATAIIGDAVAMDSATNNTQTRISALNTNLCAVTAVTAATCKIVGTITVNAGGTFIPRFAQNASNGTSSTVAIGSTMIVNLMT